MTETRFTWQWLFVVGGIGIVAGLVIGLIIGWVLAPAAASAVDVSALNASAQNDYIVMVSNSFAFDDDLPLARERLALLKDAHIETRVERLAKALVTRKDPNAANVADLAVALGSTDSSLQVLAASISNAPAGEPTKVARPEVEATATLDPTTVPTSTPAATATATTGPTLAPTKPVSLVVRNTPTTAPTNSPAAPAPAPTTFLPTFPSQWWDSQLIAANASTGQQYWHLIWALYCDWNDTRNNCPDMPGGNMDHTIYVMVLNPSGGCANNPTVRIQQNDGELKEYGAEQAKSIPYAWYSSSCQTDWEKEMYGEGNDVSVEGQPSDTITNLVLCSKTPPPGLNPPPCGHVHVRYFLVFQLTTR